MGCMSRSYMVVVEPQGGLFLTKGFLPGGHFCLLSLTCVGPSSCRIPGVM